MFEKSSGSIIRVTFILTTNEPRQSVQNMSTGERAGIAPEIIEIFERCY